jgi:hypothetical protein
MSRLMIALVTAGLLIAARARADESFTAKDGTVWAVHRDARSGNQQAESTKLHITRGAREVAGFVESSSFQTNPAIMMWTSYAFRLDEPRGLIVTQTAVVVKRWESEHGSQQESVTTTTILTWNGTTFVAGKPTVTKEKTS